MSNLSDEQLKEGLRRGDRGVLQEIYRRYHDRLVAWVCQNQGRTAEGEDVFQDALAAIYQQLQNPEFEIKYSLAAYLNTVCRNLWYKRLRDDKALRQARDTELEFVASEEAASAAELEMKEKLFQRKFAQLGQQCQRILQLALEGFSPQQIADTLQLKSERHATNQKSYCKRQLVQLVRQDAHYKELMA